MSIAIKEIKSTVRAAIMRRSRVCINFFLKCKCYGFVETPNFPFLHLIDVDTLEHFANHKADFNESFTEDNLQAALDGVLAPLIHPIDFRKTLVECAVKEVLRVLKTEPLCSRKRCNFNLDVDVEAEYESYHMYDHDDADADAAAADDDDHMVPAAESSIECLKKVIVVEQRTCSICLEDLVAGEEFLSMPCHHVFHRGCIHQWLSTSHYCPICRFEMPTAHSTHS